MALGGGTYLFQNKTLAGSYINFVALKKASVNLSDRGYCTMPFELDWGVDGEVFEVTNDDFIKNSNKIFGYDYTHEKLKGLRDLFLNAKVLYAYRLNSGEKATCTYATAKYTGIRGNDIAITIKGNIDNESAFDVLTYLSGYLVDTQTVSEVSKLVDNDFVVWKNTALEEISDLSLSGGTNGEITGLSHQEYLSKIENYSFNILGVVTTENTIKQLYTTFTKRMREEVGAKFQTVLHSYSADYEGVINIKNNVLDDGLSIASLVYWVTGLECGCLVNKSCLNKKYVGEFKVYADYSQTELVKAVKNGEFTLHKVNGVMRTLADINSMVTVTDERSDDFKENQTMRVLDQIANDIAVLFNTKYIGEVPNDNAGRVSLWADIVKHHEELAKVRAIENFSDKDVVVEQGDTKKAVVVKDKVTVVNAMAQLYMTVVVA